MFTFASDFWTSKTTWTGLAGIAVAWLQVYQGVLDAQHATFITFTALSVIFHRDSGAKKAERESTDRRKLLNVAMKNEVPTACLKAAMAAHVELHQEGLKCAVASAVEIVLHEFLNATEEQTQSEAKSEAKPDLILVLNDTTEPYDGEVDRE